LRRGERETALALLSRDPSANLILVDAVLRQGQPPVPGEMRTRVLAAWADGELEALASVQPAIAISAGASEEAVEALVPHLAGGVTGLVKTRELEAARIWERVRAHGRRALLDRCEIAYAVRPEHARLVDPPSGARTRGAVAEDLDALVEAARASLREEDRPDPFEGDVEGFRRWVAGRLARAEVLEFEGAPRFTAYADVRAPQGWLLQGVYSWPAWRRRGFAAAGVSSLCRAAFAERADHVQLAVVEGNRAGEALYHSLGFRAFERLRTILFT
jgi:RimJ/RimL family protein N-acetyltransferase